MGLTRRDRREGSGRTHPAAARRRGYCPQDRARGEGCGGDGQMDGLTHNSKPDKQKKTVKLGGGRTHPAATRRGGYCPQAHARGEGFSLLLQSFIAGVNHSLIPTPPIC